MYAKICKQSNDLCNLTVIKRIEQSDRADYSTTWAVYVEKMYPSKQELMIQISQHKGIWILRDALGNHSVKED